MKNSTKPICGAKNRQGNPCEKPPLKGKRRCKLHGGKSPVGQTNTNYAHGIYTSGYTPDEIAMLEQLNERLGSVDDEITLIRIRLRRAQLAEAKATEERKLLEMAEVRHTTDGVTESTTTVEKPTDYHGIIDRLSGRLGSLMKLRAELIQAASVDASTMQPMPWKD